MKDITWIFFDLDDTLVHSTEFYATVLKEMGVLQDPLWSKAREAVKTQLGPLDTSARNRVLYFKKYLEMQSKFSAAQSLHLIQTYEEKLALRIKEQWKSLQRKEFFQELGRRYQLGIVTNENARTQLVKLNAMDPEGELFHFMLTSEDAGCEKPNLSIFHQALSRAEVSAEKVLFVGDSLENDCLPALQLGMKVLQTVEFEDEGSYPEIQRISSLPQLRDFL